MSDGSNIGFGTGMVTGVDGLSEHELLFRASLSLSLHYLTLVIENVIPLFAFQAAEVPRIYDFLPAMLIRLTSTFHPDYVTGQTDGKPLVAPWSLLALM